MQKGAQPITLEAHLEIKQDLMSELDLEIILQKHLIERKSFYFNDFLKIPDVEYDLRLIISTSLNIHINDVIVVGSAKLGFSPKTIEFRAFDKGTDKKGKPKLSDIDIAIINRECFDSLSYDIYKLSNHFSKRWISAHWHRNRYYRNDNLEEQKNIYSLYTEYIAKGWFRPDFLPEAFLSNWELNTLLEKMRKRLSRKISIGVYSNWTFFKHYQMDNFNALRLGLITGDDIK